MEKKKWRFYRSGLSTIVWDRDREDVLADFSQGHFTTEDPRVAKILTAYGYPEIALDAEKPPDIVVESPVMTIEGDVPLMRGSASEKIMEARMKSITTEQKPNIPQTVEAKEKPEPKPKPKRSSNPKLPRRKKKED